MSVFTVFCMKSVWAFLVWCCVSDFSLLYLSQSLLQVVLLAFLYALAFFLLKRSIYPWMSMSWWWPFSWNVSVHQWNYAILKNSPHICSIDSKCMDVKSVPNCFAPDLMFSSRTFSQRYIFLRGGLLLTTLWEQSSSTMSWSPFCLMVEVTCSVIWKPGDSWRLNLVCYPSTPSQVNKLGSFKRKKSLELRTGDS